MRYIAIAAILAWLVYSPKIAIGILLLAGLIAPFYCAAIHGSAKEKLVKTFAAIVLALSVLLVGIVNHESADGGPKMCNRVEC